VAVKRILAFLLASAVVLSTVFGVMPFSGKTVVEAARGSDYQEYYDEYSMSLTDRCIEFQNYLTTVGTQQYGLLYSLRILSQYAMYVHFMDCNYKELGISSRSVSMYEQDLREEFDSFNARFSKKSDNYECLEIKCTFTGVGDSDSDNDLHSTAKKDIQKFLVGTVPDYLNKLLKGVQDEVTQAHGDTSKEQKVKDENATLLSNIYSIRSYMLEAKSDLGTFTPFDKDGKHTPYKVKSDKVTVEDALEKAFKGYDDLGAVAQKTLMNEQTEEEITVDLSLHYADNLSDAVTKSTGVEIPENPNLSRLYYAIMAASSVYVPLQSYVGNSEFQSAVKSLTNDDTVQKQIVEFYSSVKDIRKPLYKRELDDTGMPTGIAKLVTIQGFFDDIREGNSGALCSILGEFKYSENSGSWLYYQGNARTYRNDRYDEVENNQDETVDTSDESTAGWGEEQDVEEEIDDTGGDEPIEDGDGDRDSRTVAGVASGVGKFFNSVMGSFSVRASAAGATPQPSDSQSEEPSESPSGVSASSPDGSSSGGSSSGGGSAATSEEVIEDSAVFAYEEITDETKMTDAQYFYGCDYSRDIDNMTYALMANILKGSSNLQYISDKSTRYLYINAFGDIVTDDNLVIFPGIANPLLYQATESYNPYTAAFMNFYPSSYRTSRQFKLISKSSIGKYLVVRQKSNKTDGQEKIFSLETESIDSVKSTSPLVNKNIYTKFSVDGFEKHNLLQYQRLIFGTDSEWDEKNSMYLYTPLVLGKSAQIGGVNVFPYIPSEDTGFHVADAVAKNMFWYLTTDAVTDKNTNTHRFNDNYILHNFILSGVDGTNNPKGYSSNTLSQYQKFVDSSGDRFLQKVMDMSSSIIDSLSGVRGVIGLRDSLQSPILGRVLVFCRQNLLLFFLAVAVALLAVFAKMRIDRFQLVVKFVACILVSYLGITVIPTYLPMLFNIAINNVSEDLTYRIMATQIEKESIGESAQELNADGSEKLDADSITVYRAGVLNYQGFVDNVNVDEDEMTAGNIVVMNRESGLFVEGDSLKINARKLYGTLKIAKDNKNEEDEGQGAPAEGESPLEMGASNAYTLKAYKTVANNLDYYAPFYQIVDSFLGQMNKLQGVTNIPRGTIVYTNGAIKDNFLLYSFINSRVFLTPGNYASEYAVEGLASEEEEDIAKEAAAVSKSLEAAFGDEASAGDFLGLSSWLTEPTDSMRKTLWYKSMAANGYYNETTGAVNQKRMNNLIKKVNRVTKNFIFDMDDLIGQLSDDTMIKIVATRALVAFCQEASDFGHWIYPFSLNYGDFSLEEVLGCVFVSNYEKYTAMDLDIVDYIGYRGGWLNLVVADILVVMLFLIAWVVQSLMPVLYLLLCLTLVLKMLAQADGKVPLKGFAKCAVIMMVCYTCLALGLVITERANGSIVCIYFMLFVCLLISYVLATVIGSVLGNWADVGDAALNVNLKNVLDLKGLGSKFSKVSVGTMTANRVNRQKRGRADGGYGDYGSYGGYGGYGDYGSYGGYGGYKDYGGYGGYGGYSNYRSYGSYDHSYDSYRYDSGVDRTYQGDTDNDTDIDNNGIQTTTADSSLEDVDEFSTGGGGDIDDVDEF